MNLVSKKPYEFQPIITANSIKSRRRHSKSPRMRLSADLHDGILRMGDPELAVSDKENVTPWETHPNSKVVHADKLAEIENTNNCYKQKMKELS